MSLAAAIEGQLAPEAKFKVVPLEDKLPAYSPFSSSVVSLDSFGNFPPRISSSSSSLRRRFGLTLNGFASALLSQSCLLILFTSSVFVMLLAAAIEGHLAPEAKSVADPTAKGELGKFALLISGDSRLPREFWSKRESHLLLKSSSPVRLSFGAKWRLLALISSRGIPFKSDEKWLCPVLKSRLALLASDALAPPSKKEVSQKPSIPLSSLPQLSWTAIRSSVGN